ncbi:MAG: hypothetical protein QNJ68_16790 [Microcoleaceae cyanobacterium MO_207.B10]|nr:hypothetical protein [Microcoleaceae cyanobacterium MO_207.B10]
MDEIIKKVITLAIPGSYLWMIKNATVQAGESGIWTAFIKLNIFFGNYVTVLIVIFLGLAAYYLSEVFVDGLLLQFYQKRLQSESA